MQIDITPLNEIKVKLDSEELFRLFVQSLDMDFVLDEDCDYHISKEGYVCQTIDDDEIIIDERGDLFVALRNVAVNLFPNVYFRNADYIYNHKQSVD